MEQQEKTLQIGKRDRTGERGAALVMVLMIAFLLLVASSALLLESSMNTSNVTDSVAEQQAYYAAESGIQSALDVLRGNTEANEPIAASAAPAAPNAVGGTQSAWANPLGWIETSASAAASPTPAGDATANAIDFRKAVTLATSNKSNDASNTPRLSRWLNYNYTPAGQSAPDRVTLGTGNYNPNNGMAFSVRVFDPDNTGTSISYSTTGRIEQADGTMSSSSRTVTSGGNAATFRYVPGIPSPRTVTINSAAADTTLGTFEIDYDGNNSGVTLTESLRFEIVFNMISPYQATRVVRGLIFPNGTIKKKSAGVTLVYDSQIFNLMGSWITLKNGAFVSFPNAVPPKIGYEVTPVPPQQNSAGVTDVTVSMTPTEPTRIVVRATGYGPRGARKQLETIVQKNFFNGLSAPATLTLVGPESKTGSPDFMFEPGDSQNVTYSGDDVVSNMLIPSIGTTAGDNLQTVENKVLCGKKCKTDIAGFPANVTEEMPFWLQNTKNLNDTIENLKLVAKSSGRYYAAGQTPPNYGDNANARGITFVDGDASISGAGGGILVCTGKLTLNGGFDFNGLIIVTGAQGVRRSGGGNGEIHGNMVVAPYNKNDLVGGFLPPQFDTRGGGTSEMRYNSSAVAIGMIAVSNFVQGVAEK